MQNREATLSNAFSTIRRTLLSNLIDRRLHSLRGGLLVSGAKCYVFAGMPFHQNICRDGMGPLCV